jgi:hypothetical protein
MPLNATLREGTEPIFHVFGKVVCIVRETIPVLTRATLEIGAEGQDLVKAPVKEKVALETAFGSAAEDAVDRFHRVKRPNAYLRSANFPIEISPAS